MCDIVAAGGEHTDLTDRDLYHTAEIEAWDCYPAFIDYTTMMEDLDSAFTPLAQVQTCTKAT